MIKKILCCLFLFSMTSFSQEAGFIHPLDFHNTKEERQRVLKYIVDNVKTTYANIGMDNPATLRMMEKSELEAFKNLTKIKNRQLLDNVIETYCKIGMCSYSTILMMYNEELKASKESLEW